MWSPSVRGLLDRAWAQIKSRWVIRVPPWHTRTELKLSAIIKHFFLNAERTQRQSNRTDRQSQRVSVPIHQCLTPVTAGLVNCYSLNFNSVPGVTVCVFPRSLAAETFYVFISLLHHTMDGTLVNGWVHLKLTTWFGWLNQNVSFLIGNYALKISQ